MRERATVWIDLADKRRPAVVIEVRDDLVRIAYVTHVEPSVGVSAVLVTERTRAGRKFPLREPTWFVGANTAWESPRALVAGSGDCTRELFDAIRALVEEHDASASGDE